MKSHTDTALCFSVPLARSPHSNSPLLPDQLEAGAWAAPPAAPSGRTVRGWSRTPAQGSLRHVSAAFPPPSGLIRHGTRPHTAAAAPEGALPRLSLGHCVPRHPGHRRKALKYTIQVTSWYSIYVHRGKKTRILVFHKNVPHSLT